MSAEEIDSAKITAKHTEAAEKATMDAKSAASKDTLDKIKSATTKDMMPSGSDIAEAMAAARAAGNPGLATELAALAFEAEQGFKKDAINSNSLSNDIDDNDLNIGVVALDKADKYFDNEDIKRSEDTANNLNNGNDVPLDDLNHLVEYHCSEEAREERENLQEELEAAELNEYRIAIKTGRKPGENLDKLADRQAQLGERTARDELISSHIGNGHSKESLKETTAAHEGELKSSLQNTSKMNEKLKENQQARKERLDANLTEAMANFDPNNPEQSMQAFAAFEQKYKAENKQASQERSQAVNTHVKEARARSAATTVTPQTATVDVVPTTEAVKQAPAAIKKAEKQAGGIIKAMGSYIKTCRKHEAEVRRDPGRSKNDVPNLKPKQRENDGPPRGESGGRTR